MLRDKYSIKLATIYHIVTKQRDKLNSQKFAGGSVIVSGLRDPKMEKMENMLQEWIELRTGVGHPPLSNNEIKKMALKIYSKGEPGKPFKASNGWLARFFQRSDRKKEETFETEDEDEVITEDEDEGMTEDEPEDMDEPEDVDEPVREIEDVYVNDDDDMTGTEQTQNQEDPLQQNNDQQSEDEESNEAEEESLGTEDTTETEEVYSLHDTTETETVEEEEQPEESEEDRKEREDREEIERLKMHWNEVKNSLNRLRDRHPRVDRCDRIQTLMDRFVVNYF